MNSYIVHVMLILAFACKTDVPDPRCVASADNKFKGIGFEAPPNPISEHEFTPMEELNANWISVMPFSFTAQGSPNLRYDEAMFWWGERKEGVIKTIEFARKSGLKVMLKPQMWLSGGQYTGDFNLATEADWEVFEENYMAFIMLFVNVAESLDVELFCVGTEMRNFVYQRPGFWNKLVDTVRSSYSGELTYAANWDDYNKFPIWDKLDYVGIDAYFPISDKKDPTEAEILNGWEAISVNLQEFYQQTQKGILFTEFGCRSIYYGLREPWNSSIAGPVNLDLQTRAYKVIFDELWPQDWLHGGFIWKWHANHEQAGGANNDDYTPQNKPAADIIKKAFE